MNRPYKASAGKASNWLARTRYSPSLSMYSCDLSHDVIRKRNNQITFNHFSAYAAFAYSGVTQRFTQEAP